MSAVEGPAAGSGLSLNSRSLPSDRQYVEKEVIKAQWGDWISNTWDWDLFATLTFDQPRAASRSSTHTGVGWALSARRFDEWLGASFGGDSGESSGLLESIYWLRGREPNPHRYGTHFHVLIGGVPTGTSLGRVEGAWREKNGIAQLEVYNPLLGAGYYVSKYVTKRLGDIQFSPNLGHFKKEQVI